MLLHDVVQTSHAVSGTSGRRAKIELLAGLLRRADPEEIETVIAFLCGSPRQPRLGIGFATLHAARPDSATSTATLTIGEVDATLARTAGISGTGSGKAREQAIRELLARATRDEQEFLFRLVIGELRQGALEGLLAEAVARAAGLDAAAVRRATMLAGDLGVVAHAALTSGAEGVARFAVQLFRPLQPMLAQTADDVATALARLGQAAFEYKLDGARIQVHTAGAEIRVFSRLLNDVTHAVPEVVEVVMGLPLQDAILDGEVIALKPDGSPHPFQVTMSRFGRKLDVERLRAEQPLTPFFFDVLSADGSALLDASYEQRITVLDRSVPEALRPSRIVTTDPLEAQAFLDRALKAGHEGVMAKALDAPYEAGARGAAWLKVKPAHTLDLVVLAAEWGHGRRKGWLSNLHLGARDTGGGFVMLGKTFKGLTDELLAWQTERLLALATSRGEHLVTVRPELVVEVAFGGIQTSRRYPGGVALRFARVLRYRPDKTPDQADTIEAVRRYTSIDPL